MALGFILCGLLLAVHLCCCIALQCLQCDRVSDPRDCSHLVTCASNEQCISQKYVGSNLVIHYSLGCVNTVVCQQILIGKRHFAAITGTDDLFNKTEVYKNKKSTFEEHNNSIFGRKHNLGLAVQFNTGLRSVGDMAVCSQCCNSASGCNAHMCGAVTNSNLQCTSCKGAIDIHDCDAVKECSTDYYCYVHHGQISFSMDLNKRYDMGCMHRLQCDALKHAYQQSCVVCCNHTDFCNYGACDNWQPQTVITPSSGYGLSTTHLASHHPTTLTTTTERTTTTQPKTTTQAPRIVINGPTIGDFDATVHLQCITVPPAQSYDWKMNGSGLLPPGVTSTTHSTVGGVIAGINTITISNLNKSSLGEYTCIATTNGHVIQATHFIDIKPAPPTVTILKGLSSNVFTLKCIVGGYPQPTIMWDFKPYAIGAHGLPPGLEYNDDGREAVIFVGNYVPTHHDGDWSCTATNSLGTAIGTATIP